MSVTEPVHTHTYTHTHTHTHTISLYGLAVSELVDSV
jgi:hypothetical protein